MFALFRNPLLRLLGRLWWLPALTLVVVFGLGGEQVCHLARIGATAYLAFIAGVMGMAWAHGVLVSLRELAHRRLSHHCFLCPNCLHLGAFHFACSACGKKIEAFLVHTNGAYVNDCPQCHKTLFSGELKERGVQAYCEQCRGHCDRAVYHQRQVRVFATLLPADFTLFCQSIGAQEKEAQGGLGYACADNGKQLTYLLNLADLTDADTPIPRAHALREVKAVWLDGTGDDAYDLALDLVKVADRFINKAGLKEDQRQAVAVCARQPTSAPEVRRVLEPRFGAIKYGVGAADFVGYVALPESRPQLNLAPEKVDAHDSQKHS